MATDADPDAGALDPDSVLARAELSIVGRIMGASNGTLLCDIDGDAPLRCVYKPVQGERPLWDFPDGTLGRREVATYRLAIVMHELDPAIACLVPPTVWRTEGPWGEGSCQLWIDAVDDDPQVDLVESADLDGWRPVLRARDERDRDVVLAHVDSEPLRRLALLDVIANNSDRKGGHILVDGHGRLYGVDHGLCFHTDDKLRTVLWGWAGMSLTGTETALLERLLVALTDDADWQSLLAPREVRATLERVERLLDEERLPAPSGEWPAIPWPAF